MTERPAPARDRIARRIFEVIAVQACRCTEREIELMWDAPDYAAERRACLDLADEVIKSAGVDKAPSHKLIAALRSVIDMETNRYACASERHRVFEEARKLISDDT